jgi:hypothetical protein
LQATIILEYDDSKTAAAIAKAVSPDNLDAPTGLAIKTVLDGNTVVPDISLNGKLATFIATIDDLLENASTAEKALHVIRKN